MKIYQSADVLTAAFALITGFLTAVTGTTSGFATQNPSDINLPPDTVAGATILNYETIQPITKINTAPEIISTPPKISKPIASGTTPSTTCGNYHGFISVGGRTICLASTNTTSGSLSHDHAYIYNGALSSNQFIFGHNSAKIFSHLAGLPVGTNFSVTIGEETKNYRISLKEITCDYSNPSHPCSNYSEPVLNMNDAAMPGRRGANLAIMTCAGTSIGNGDATHRLVVYATQL